MTFQFSLDSYRAVMSCGGKQMQGQGDTVTAIADESAEPGSVMIEQIVGDGGRLSLKIEENCVGIAARETLRLTEAELSCGVRLRLHKGLPLGSGMGSSAASAAAACWAVNLLFGKPLQKRELVYACLQSEMIVSGYHADNIAPALFGGFVLVRCVLTASKCSKIFPAFNLVWLNRHHSLQWLCQS
jgi:homoserine kinase